MSVMDRLENLTRKPLEAIQGINALALALFGLYVASPLYIPATPSAASTAFGGSLALRITFCLVFFVIPALPTLLGFFKERFRTRVWRARACMAMFIGLGCLTLLRILAVGLLPPIWLFYLATGLTSAILYLYWKVPR